MKIEVLPVALIPSTLSSEIKKSEKVGVILVSSELNRLPYFKKLFEDLQIPHLILNFAEGFFPPDATTEKDRQAYLDYLRKKEAELRTLGIITRLTPIFEEEASQIINFFLEIRNHVNLLLVCCDEGKYRSQAIARFLHHFFLDESYEPQTFDTYTYTMLQRVFSKLFPFKT